jgi:hypothetical protein
MDDEDHHVCVVRQGFAGKVYLHLSTDKPPFTARDMLMTSPGHFSVWKASGALMQDP